MELSKETLLERQNDALNELADLFQAYDERLTLECRDWGQRYIDGRLEIALKLRSGRYGDEFHLVISSFQVRSENDSFFTSGRSKIERRLVSGNGNEVPSVGAKDHVTAVLIPETDEPPAGNYQKRVVDLRSQIDWLDWLPVPLVSCVVMERPEVLVPSRLRLGLLDEVDCAYGEKLFQFFKFGTVFLHVIPEGEADLIDFPAMIIRDIGNHVIERLPEILQDVFGRRDHSLRDIARAELICFLRSLRIDAGPYGVSIRSEPLLNCGIELLDVGIGPFDLSVRPDKGFRFHDIESIMAKDDDLKATKNLMGALVRMRPKQHDEMKIGKPKAKKAKSRAKKRASSKRKTA
jgi:hypothetical protein